jgi:hypothetical protein
MLSPYKPKPPNWNPQKAPSSIDGCSFWCQLALVAGSLNPSNWEIYCCTR